MSVYNNNVVIVGNLCKEAEIKDTSAGTVASFTLGVYRSGKGKEAVSDFIRVTCWHDICRGMAEVDKGTKLIVAGTIVTRSYEVEGVKKYVTEILAREIGRDISIKKDDIGSEDEPF